jgi:HEPN domain-containing protein
MPELPDDNYREARRWLGNVEDDLHAMRAVARDPESPGRMACFLAHLVTEKALKATLIDAGVPFKKTHDLVALHAMCIQVGRLPGVGVATFEVLDPWAVDGRYADDLAEADTELANRMASFAEQVVAEVRRELEAERGRQ